MCAAVSLNVMSKLYFLCTDHYFHEKRTTINSMFLNRNNSLFSKTENTQRVLNQINKYVDISSVDFTQTSMTFNLSIDSS